MPDSFSDQIVDKAWDISGGHCECNFASALILSGSLRPVSELGIFYPPAQGHNHILIYATPFIYLIQ